ncbi:MAG TPA: type I methionyl aminopeptidase [Acidimicrobiia bacterium]|uniref:Methionine aminopeptidase n=1 Tax=uncultured actinobacterium Rifle_16ft_4_minimus_3564 TaxID=1665147 RepID=A0A0H4T603_9ACTN|nr:methionine aminopeptidase, methionyl aminopeptidase [uncultured actinobacterium Rifle_16ft_4_minimus_3564]HKZ30503.1 type I methionyl aminopeptidase [Acidimicrobiia bacterium]
MITIKSRKEFEKMAVAGQTVAVVLETVKQAAGPGVSLTDLDAIAAEVIRARGCTPSFLGYHGYPASICTSPNGVIVHGIPSDYRLVEGDVLSVDAGAIFEGFHGDAAITFPIGEVSPEARLLIDTTERALAAGITQVKAGARLGDIGHAVESEANRHGFGVVREYVGHGIGRQMHEDPQVPNYGKPGTGTKLRRGMAICIEPMFNLGGQETVVETDGWTVMTADGSLSAHFEHTVAITDRGPLVMTLLGATEDDLAVTPAGG